LTPVSQLETGPRQELTSLSPKTTVPGYMHSMLLGWLPRLLVNVAMSPPLMNTDRSV
jgi:hypothetical protein